MDDVDTFEVGVLRVQEGVASGNTLFNITTGPEGNVGSLIVGSQRVIEVYVGSHKMINGSFVMCMALSRGQLEFIRDQCQTLLDGTVDDAS